ncbi:MAG: hypothetical protein R6U89_01035 [Dehalococcoidia bacterium]
MKVKAAFLLGVILAMIIFPGSAHLPISDAPTPQLYDAKASPNVVNFGAQPQGSPLVLSVRVGAGGEIDKITVDIERLSGAGYYDPVADRIIPASTETSMKRIYEIDGVEAYLIEAGSRYRYNEYRTAITHRIVRGVAEPTDKWQVELPDAGHGIDSFKLKVSAVNKHSHSNSIRIPLRVVDDIQPPAIALEAMYNIDAPAVRPGDEVVISATAYDDMSGIYSVRLAGTEPSNPFGETSGTAMTKDRSSCKWIMKTSVGRNTLPGTYTVELVATDRAGNETGKSLELRVNDKITSYYIRLDKGWNLISVPRNLADAGVSDVFAGTGVEEVWTVIEDQWLEPGSIQPGRGYLVKATEKAALEVDFAERDAFRRPLTMKLGAGWHLIGYASRSLEPAMPLTHYLGADLKGEWAVLYNESGAQARAKSTSPYVWAMDSFPTMTGRPLSEDKDNLPAVELGHGYWIYIIGEGVFIP